jgi:hypothetical protein
VGELEMTDKRDEERSKSNIDEYLMPTKETIRKLEILSHPKGFLGIRWGAINWKPFVYGFMILIIYHLYYFISPYQNCISDAENMIDKKYSKLEGTIRSVKSQWEEIVEQKESKQFCNRNTSW